MNRKLRFGQSNELKAQAAFLDALFDVATLLVDDSGVDLLIRKQNTRKWIEVQVKSVNDFNLAFVRDSLFPEEDFLLVVVRHTPENGDQMYLFKRSDFHEDNKLCVYRSYEGRKTEPCCELRLNQRTVKNELPKYEFSKRLKQLDAKEYFEDVIYLPTEKAS